MAILFLVSAMLGIAFSEPNKMTAASYGNTYRRQLFSIPPITLDYVLYSSSFEKMSVKLAGKSRWFGECKDAIRELENRGNT